MIWTVYTKHVKSETRREHRELQADVEQQGWETPPHKPGPPAGLREGLARALQAGLQGPLNHDAEFR